MAKTTETLNEFIINTLTAEQYAAALKNGEIDSNQLYLTPEKKLVVAVTEEQYESMKQAGTLDEDVIYVTPTTEQITIDEATQSEAGLMSATDKIKLDGIAQNANNYSHPTYTARSNGLYKITVNSLGHVTAVSTVQKSDIVNLGIPGTEITVDSVLSSSSTNPAQNKAIYAAIPWEYSATFYEADWSDASSDEQEQGFAYKQTVYPTKKISAAPNITADSMFLGFGTCQTTGVLSTDMTLSESRDTINGGFVYTGSGTITALVEEKPSSDVTMSWWLKT